MADSGSLTRAGLARAVHERVGLPQSESARLVEEVLRTVADALVDGDEVKLTGFGTFTLRDKGERVGRNPKTGVAVPVTPRRVVGFRASQMVRDRVAKAPPAGVR